MRLSEDDLNTVLDLLHDDRIQVYKQAIEILVQVFQGSILEVDVNVAQLLDDKNAKRLLSLLNLHWTEVIGGSIMALLINLASAGEKNPYIIRRLCDLNSASCMMQFLRAKKVFHASSCGRSEAESEAELQNLHEIADLIALFLSNLTSSLNEEAIKSLLQLDLYDEMSRGFYFETILDHVAARGKSCISIKWLLYVIVNLCSSATACARICSHEQFLRYLQNVLQEGSLRPNEFMCALKIVRNVAFSNKSVPVAHTKLIEFGIMDEIMENLKTPSDSLTADACTLLGEAIFALCTSTEGIQWIESINGKKIMLEVLANSRHMVNTPLCTSVHDLLTNRLVPVLDDIQDVALASGVEGGEAA